MRRFAGVFLAAIWLNCGLAVGQSGVVAEKVRIPAKEGVSGGRLEDITLDAALYRPAGDGPFPIVIFNHGFTGGSRRSPAFTALSEALVARGIAVIFPARRGINDSGGRFYQPASCDIGENQAGVLHALEDIDAAVAFARSQPFLDANRLVMGGQSRGGILSVVYAARYPKVPIKGIVNFVGIWNDDRCPAINDVLFAEAAGTVKVPNLWLYGDSDRMTSNSSAKHYADIYQKGGGNVVFKIYTHDIGNGHSLVYSGSRFWLDDLGHFLDSLAFGR